MLIQESFVDVPTKAGGDGSMRMPSSTSQHHSIGQR